MRINEPTRNRLVKSIDRAEGELNSIRKELSSDIDPQALSRRIKELERHIENMRAVVGFRKENP